MEHYSSFETWFIIFLAALVTFGWRFAGLILSDYIHSDSRLMLWINAVAYAMVAGVLMKLMVYPVGILESTPLDYRLAGLAVGLFAMISTRSLWLSLLLAMGLFAILVSYF